jgi:hypothetical protein
MSEKEIDSALPVGGIGSSGCGNLWLPLVTVGQKLLLVVQQLFSGLGGVFRVGSCAYLVSNGVTLNILSGQLTLNNSINGATLLAVTTVDALGHINVISGCPTASVLAFLGLNRNGLSGADGLTELASDATLLTSGIATQSMFATETGGDRTLLEGVEDGITINLEI